LTSLHKNGLDFTKYSSFCCSEPAKKLVLNIICVGGHIPTSSGYLALISALNPPKMGKIPLKRPKYQ
jgi:hypothetical protein